MKTLGIKTIDGIDNPVALDDAIVPATINTSSLGSLVLSIIDTAEDLVCLVVDVAARKVYGFPAVAETATAIVADLIAQLDEDNNEVIHNFAEKVDATKRKSAWLFDGIDPFTIGAGEDLAYQDVIKPEQPELSSGELVGAYEDAFLGDGELGAAPTFLVLDQGTGKFHFIQPTDDGPLDLVAARAALAADATIGYEQIPAVTSSTTREPLG